MVRRQYVLAARVDTDAPESVLPVLKSLLPDGTVETGSRAGEFQIRARMRGEDAKVLNRELLSALRRAEKKTTLRAEWKAEDGTVSRYFDYVLKRTWKE